MSPSDFKYVYFKELADDPKYPFSFSQLREYLLHREKNGLAKAVRKIGKRLYIRTDLFEEWINSHGS